MDKITVEQFRIAYKLLNQMFDIVLYTPNDVGSLREAVEHGADVNVHDNSGNTLLHRACEWSEEKDSVEMVRYLLEQGADINAENDAGETPLYWAANAGNVNVVRLLLEQGADATIGDEDRETPLHCVLRKDPGMAREDMIEIFVQHVPDSTLEVIRDLPEDDPDREEILELLRQYAPELVIEAYCTAGPGGVR